MNLMDELKLMIYESNLSEEEIHLCLEAVEECETEDEFYETADDVLCLMESSEEVFMEKKTKTQYALEKFKKKYHYDPETGMVEINGVKHKLSAMKKSGCFAAMDLGDGTIHLDKEFFQLGNQKERDAIINHESGHGKMQTGIKRVNAMIDAKGKVVPYEEFKKIFPNVSRSTYVQMIHDYRETLKSAPKYKRLYDPDDIKYSAALKDSPGFTGNGSDLKQSNFYDYAKKYLQKTGVPNDHLNAKELEADAYAASKSGAKNFRKGLSKAYRIGNKQVKRFLKKHPDLLTNEELKNEIRRSNESDQKEFKIRMDALKDKGFQKRSEYLKNY